MKTPKSITFTVTREDIENGVPKTCDACPIALALQRKGYDVVDILDDEVYVERNLYIAPFELYAFIRRFDRKETVSPTKFTIKKA